jgi:hypothetical protein
VSGRSQPTYFNATDRTGRLNVERHGKRVRSDEDRTDFANEFRGSRHLLRHPGGWKSQTTYPSNGLGASEVTITSRSGASATWTASNLAGPI